MRKINLLLVSTVCLIAIGCHAAIKKEVQAYINEKDELILQMGKVIEANPTQTGVDEARKIFETKKTDLKSKKMDLFKKDIPFDMVQKLLNSNVSDNNMFNSISSLLKDWPVRESFTKLQNDFTDEFHK